MLIARLLTISGDVQGVGYRFFAQRSAAAHQVRGYVKNLDDGRVEALVEGDVAAVKGFINDLAAGPAYSRVAEIEELVVEPDGSYSSFRIER
jgi:acylphosphatase